MQVASAIQNFRMRFTRDADVDLDDLAGGRGATEDNLALVINAVRELDRRTSEWERKGIARAN